MLMFQNLPQQTKHFTNFSIALCSKIKLKKRQQNIGPSNRQINSAERLKV